MKKKLIVYYSYGNNTRKVAKQIQKATNADICEIETVEPYAGDYNSVVDQGKREVDSGYKPEIKPISVRFEDYDTIILGTPVWWYTYAPAVATFLSEFDLSGKRVISFATNGGWIGHTIKDIEDACRDSKIINPIDIKFDKDTMLLSQEKLEKWITSL